MPSRRQLLTASITGGISLSAGCSLSPFTTDKRTYQATIHNTTEFEQEIRLVLDLSNGEKVTNEYSLSPKKAEPTSEYQNPIERLIVDVNGRPIYRFDYSTNQNCPGNNDSITVLVEDEDILAAGTCGEIRLISPNESSNSEATET